MSNQVISYADLSIINNALRSLASDMNVVNSNIHTLGYKQDKLEIDLAVLAETFAAFVKADLKHKALQLAETRQGNLKQDLQIKFGYYAEVRRMTTGILQGVDTGVLSDSVIQFTTEEVLIKAPGYWLASAIVAMSAWLRNDRDTHEKALKESLNRDDYKTTLFFMLVMRRVAKNEASFKWLERYFMHQNPRDLDREFIIILEAVTTGIFTPAAKTLMMKNVQQWLNQLSEGDDFVTKQKDQWVSYFEAIAPLDDNKYLLLQKYSKNYNDLENGLSNARVHKILKDHFNKIFSSSADFSKGIKVQLDEILSMLVTNFDDEELPLQQQVRLNQLIIQMDGDTEAAQALMDAEIHAYDEKVDFLQLLTNACFNPEAAGATTVTQALAISISQPWIIDAHDSFTATTRAKYPKEVELSIDDFQCTTTDGANENELINKQNEYYDSIETSEINSLQYPIGTVGIGILVCLGAIWAITKESYVLGLIGLGIGAIIGFQANKKHGEAKNQIRESINEQKQKASEVLRGCIAEVVDYRKELTYEDRFAEEFRDLIQSVQATDFSSKSKDTSRAIL